MSAAGDPDIQILINADATVARVVAPADTSPTFMTTETLGQIAAGHSLHIDHDVQRRFADICASFAEDPRDLDEVVATAVKPITGQDGWLEWMPGFEPDASGVDTTDAAVDESDADADTDGDAAAAEDDDPVDHYNSRSYVQIEEQVHIATLHEPTGGTDGVDVCGQVIPAMPGHRADVRLHHSVELQAGGRIIAATDGVLRFDSGLLRVSRLLEVGIVDFSTGNITYDGSVIVHKGVRDNFVVDATEDLTVHGLVESAELRCGRDLTCTRGIAARGSGRIDVGGAAYVGFLNDLEGDIVGDLSVRREIMNCTLSVGGHLHAERGSIIGGTTIVTGAVNVAALGSDADPITYLELGSVPLLSGQIRRLDRVIRELDRRIQTIDVEHQKLTAIREPSNSDKEKLTEIAYELSEYRGWLTDATEKRDTLNEFVKKTSRVDVRVRQTIHPRVTLRIGDKEASFTETLRGPIRIYRDENRRLFYSQGESEPVRLSEVARIQDLAA